MDEIKALWEKLHPGSTCKMDIDGNLTVETYRGIPYRVLLATHSDLIYPLYENLPDDEIDAESAKRSVREMNPILDIDPILDNWRLLEKPFDLRHHAPKKEQTYMVAYATKTRIQVREMMFTGQTFKGLPSYVKAILVHNGNLHL